MHIQLGLGGTPTIVTIRRFRPLFVPTDLEKSAGIVDRHLDFEVEKTSLRLIVCDTIKIGDFQADRRREVITVYLRSLEAQSPPGLAKSILEGLHYGAITGSAATTMLQHLCDMIDMTEMMGKHFPDHLAAELGKKAKIMTKGVADAHA